MSDFENGCAGSCDACGSKSDCEKATVTLTLDDGSMMECAILTIFEADEKEYIALLPLDEKGNASEEGDVYLYRFQEVNGNPTLDNILLIGCILRHQVPEGRDNAPCTGAFRRRSRVT